MGFNPLKERGTPFDKQVRNWSQLDVQPYDKTKVHPYTRCRIITMNGLEIQSALNSHQFARHCDTPDIKASLALLRRIEQQQQKVLNWLIPVDETILEATLGYEQVAVDLTAFIARHEVDPYLKQTFEFGLLEDFDHLYRYANLLDLIEGKDPKSVIGDYTEVMAGRPTKVEHRFPYDDIRAHYDQHTVDPLSRLHTLTILASEQQTMNFYMNIGNRYPDALARGLYQEIAMVEEQHVTQYESLLDPMESWFMQEVFQHYNECYMYYSFMNQETDSRIKGIWEEHLHMEIEHLRIAGELLERYEGIEAAEILPKELPELTFFEPNKAYIRNVLANQVNLRTMGPMFMPEDQLPKSAMYYSYQKSVNGGDFIPSERVIKEHQDKKGFTIQFLSEGPHPIEAYRTK